MNAKRYFSLIALASFTFFVSACSDAQTQPSEKLSAIETTDVSNNVNNYSEDIDNLIGETNDSLSPYFEVMGTDITEGNPDVSEEFIDNMDAVFVMGTLGTVEHGWSDIDGRQYIDLLTWTSNDTYTQHEYYEFLELLGGLFGTEGVIGDYKHIAEEVYEWVVCENEYSIISWYEANHIKISWEKNSILESTYSESITNSDDYENSSNVHYCEASGCYKEGIYSIVGISGDTEYYCYTHYNEMNDMWNDMVDDVYDSYNAYDDYGQGYGYDPSDPYYSANDHNNDGYLTDEEFLDALGDAFEDYGYMFE